MKLYRFTVPYCSTQLYNIEVFEAEEKPKTYIINEKYYKSRVNKDKLDKVEINLWRTMYSLSDNPIPYLRALLQLQEGKIRSLQNELEDAELKKNLLMFEIEKQEKESYDEG